MIPKQFFIQNAEIITINHCLIESSNTEKIRTNRRERKIQLLSTEYGVFAIVDRNSCSDHYVGTITNNEGNHLADFQPGCETWWLQESRLAEILKIQVMCPYKCSFFDGTDFRLEWLQVKLGQVTHREIGITQEMVDKFVKHKYIDFEI